MRFASVLGTAVWLRLQVLILIRVTPARHDPFIGQQLEQFVVTPGFKKEGVIQELVPDWLCERHRDWWVLSDPCLGHSGSTGWCMCGKSPRFDASFRTSGLAWWGAALGLFLISGVVIMVWTASMWPAVLTPVILSFVCRWHSLVPFQQLRIWTWCLSGHADVTARGGYGMIFVCATMALLYGCMRGVFPWFHASFRASRNAWLGVALLLLQICGVITTVWTVSVQPVELTYFPYNVDRTVWLPRSLRSMEMVDCGPPSTILVWVEDRPCL